MKDNLENSNNLNNQAEMRELLHFQLFYRQRKIIATWALAGIIAFMFLLEEIFGGSTNTALLVKMGANVSELVAAGQYWRLMTCVFLHAGYMHVLLNTYVLFALGGFFNRILGDAVYLSVFLISGITGSLASTFLGKAQVSVGASGAIWGLFGASLAISFIKNPLIPEIVRLSMRRVTLINLAINLGVSFLPMVDIWAHIGGGVGGFLVSLGIITGPSSPNFIRMRAWFFRVLAVLFSLAYALSIGIAMVKFKPWVNELALPFERITLPGVPFSLSLPPALKITPGVKNQTNNATFTFGNLKFNNITIELHLINESVLQESLNDDWLSMQRNKLLKEPGLSADVKKSIDLRKESFGNLLFFQQELKNKLNIYNYIFIRDNYLVKLILIFDTKTKQVVVENMARKIIESLQST
jgi:rhomboid protease GluP